MELAARIKRSVTEVLLWRRREDLAAALLEADWEFKPSETNQENDLHIGVPAQYLHSFADESPDVDVVRTIVRQVSRGHTFDMKGFPYELATIFVGQLLAYESDWEEVVKAQIAQAQVTNQALVTEAAFRRAGKEPVKYGELKFGSRTEVRIAQELENRGVMFFPLAVAVKASTGINHKDHREVDFLIVQDGVVGILEVAGPNHAGRQVADIEKDKWFQDAGIVCLKEYPAELCWSDPAGVVTGFLSYLALHKR